MYEIGACAKFAVRRLFFSLFFLAHGYRSGRWTDRRR